MSGRDGDSRRFRATDAVSIGDPLLSHLFHVGVHSYGECPRDPKQVDTQTLALRGSRRGRLCTHCVGHAPNEASRHGVARVWSRQKPAPGWLSASRAASGVPGAGMRKTLQKRDVPKGESLDEVFRLNYGGRHLEALRIGGKQ
jgi:hypothetical protein